MATATRGRPARGRDATGDLVEIGGGDIVEFCPAKQIVTAVSSNTVDLAEGRGHGDRPTGANKDTA
jgi:hypothetical protein